MLLGTPMQYAEVAVNVPVSMTFHYHIPPELAGRLQPGHLVRVSFGTAEQPGVVLTLSDQTPVLETKPVLELLDPMPVMDQPHIDTARWLSRETLAPLGSCLWLFLPPGIAGRSDVRLSLIPAHPLSSGGEGGLDVDSPAPQAERETKGEVPAEGTEDNLDPTVAQLLSLLARRGPLRGRQVAAAMRGKAWERAADVLVRQGRIRREAVLSPPAVQPHKVRTARLAIPVEQVDAVAPLLGRESRRAGVLEVLRAAPDARLTVAACCLAAGCGEQVVRALADAGDVTLTPKSRWLELTVPTDQMNLRLQAGEFDRAAAQKAALTALVAAGGALPAGEISSSVAGALAKQHLVRSGEQSATVELAARYRTPDGRIDSAALAARLLDLREGHQALSVLRLLAREEAAVAVNWIDAQTGAPMKLLQELAEEGLILLGEEDAWRDPLAGRDFAPTVAPPFTRDQQAAWERLREHMDALHWEGLSPAPDAPHVFLLQGVTGSGKTEIYLRAVEHTLAHGRGAIVLVPEIALTPQTVARFAARFPGQVTVVHGELAPGERFDAWRRARSGELRVIVGTRSALFTPLPDLGLVVLDEEHDHSYKQSPPHNLPCYHARETAIELTRRSRGVVILGSATPSVESVYAAGRGLMQRIDLPARVAGHRAVFDPGGRYHPERGGETKAALPPVQIVDMRAELKQGNTSMFSRALQAALDQTLARGEQAILFLNRRGTASYVFCRDCGYVAKCPQCDMPLTYHQEGDTMRCHHCGFRAQPPHVCPSCRGRRIKHFGAGTETVQQALGDLFPQARSIRWDRDTAAGHRAHEVILTRFANRDADVLIGTQMVAKGIDLPGVTLVGVLNADVGIALPDFRAAERTFQLLTQVVGRAGRADQPGRGIIQTYQPDHPAIQAAARHDTAGFYAREIKARRDLGYPPFRRFARLVIYNASAPQAQKDAERAAGMLRARIAELKLDGTELIGPAPCFFGKLEGLYRWHVLVRSADPAAPFRGLDLPKGWHLDVDPLDVL